MINAEFTFLTLPKCSTDYLWYSWNQ